MFAICEYGSYEDYGVFCIKINPSNKELFEKYCLDSQKVGGSDGISLELMGYSDLDYTQFTDDIKRLNVCIDIEYITIKEHQKIISEEINYIPEHGNHYLKNKTAELSELLKYKFD